jgi:predicted HicB family RNase H-like nuclease
MQKDESRKETKPMDRADLYTYRVLWSSEDDEFVGLVAEFPSLSHLATERHAALEGIVGLVREVLQDMETSGEVPPEPLAQKQYSGELRLRMPPAMHKKLALEAAEEKTSLNAVIVRRLAAF